MSLLLASVLLCSSQAYPSTRHTEGASGGVLPVDLLLGDGLKSEPFLSDDGEVMDAASLLHLIEKLKEEYAEEKVRGSFDRLAATLHALSSGDRPGTAADTLAMLSEEESEEEEDTGMMYPDYYSDGYEDSSESDPSLLQLQAWTRKLANSS